MEVEPDGERGPWRHGADAPEQLPFAIVQVLGHHGAVQGEEDRVAAVPDRADDCLAHVLVGGLLDIARRVGAGSERNDDLRFGFLGDVEEAAELGIRVAELLDGRLPGERAERCQGCRHGREGIRLVHHHRDHDLAAGHGLSPA